MGLWLGCGRALKRKLETIARIGKASLEPRRIAVCFSGDFGNQQPESEIMIKERRKGQRVFMKRYNEKAHEIRPRYGTVEHDANDGSDCTSVRFDDAPDFVQAVITYYLFSDGAQPKE
jgi:hypothetical protein